MTPQDPANRSGQTPSPHAARGARPHTAGEFAHDLAYGVSKQARRSWRKWKWLVRIVVGTPVVIGIVILLLMRSPLVGWVADGQVYRLTGCHLTSTKAFIDLNGRLVMEGPVISSPATPGEAGKIVRAESATFDLDWSLVLSGSVGCTTVHLNKPEMLVSQSMVDQTLNIATVAKGVPPKPPGGGLPPAVDVVDGTIILAEHNAAGRVTPLKRIDVAGSFTPTRADKPVYAARMYEITRTEVGPARGMIVNGNVNLEAGTLSLKLNYLPLTAWPPESVPSVYRDLWRRLNIQGEVKAATLTSTPETGLVLEAQVSGVSINALIPTEETFTGPHKDLVLTSVNGTVRLAREGLLAKLTGEIEGQPGRSRVTLRTEGLGPAPALSCEIVGRRVELSKDPEFLPYVPATVRRYLRYFSGPTAEVDARATIRRGPPEDGKPGEYTVSGQLAFERGTAAFHKFPYPFHDLAGRVEFDEKTIRVLNIRGKGPTGAALSAQGVISPLTDDAGVDVTVQVADVPVDEHLLSAMPENRRQVVKTVFSRGAYDGLLGAGLIRLPNEMGKDGTRAAPPFEFGGVAALEVRVRRREGPESVWLTDIDVRFPQAGIVARPFPLPIVGRNVHLHITDDDARLVSGEFVGLNGGKAEVSAVVKFYENGEKVVDPDIRIAAFGIPIDPLLKNALPGESGGDEGKGGGAAPHNRSARRLVEDLGVTGTLEAGVMIRAAAGRGTPENPDIDYDVSVQLNTLHGAPVWNGAPSGLILGNVGGVLRITREQVLASDVHAEIGRPTTAGEAGPPVQVGTVVLDARAALTDAPAEERGRFEASVRMTGLKLDEPFERLLGVVSDEAPAFIADLRASRAPAGRLDATIDVRQAGGMSLGGMPGAASRPDVRVAIERTEGVEVDALGGRLGLMLTRGAIDIALPARGDAFIEADDAAVALSLDGRAAGEAVLRGFVSIDPASGSARAPAHFEASLEGWRLDSPLIEPLVRSLGDEGAAREYRELAPAGEFRGAISIRSGQPGVAAGRLALTGFVQPRSIALNRRGRRVVFEDVSGRVTFESDPDRPDATRGTVDGVVVAAPDWRGWIDGEWTVAGPPGARSLRLDAAVGVDARRVDEELLTLVPDSVWSGLEALNTRIDGRLSLSRGHVVTTLGGGDGRGGGPSESGFAGRIEAGDVSLDLGVPVRAPLVVAEANWPDEHAQGPAPARIDVNIPALSVAAIGMERGHIAVTRSERPGVLTIPEIEAVCHGGRIAGEARITTAGAGGGRAAYQADIVGAGVQFAPVLAELTRAGAAADMTGPMPDERTDPDLSRGQLDARLSIAGVAGDAGSRIGRGALRIAHGQVIRLPVIFPLLQVSNFMLPARDRFDELEASFHIAGREAVFEDVALRSRTISIVGGGTLTLPELTLDMHFNSEANSRLPLLSGAFEAIRNEFITTSITGSIMDPMIGTETLFGTRKVLRQIAGLAEPVAPADSAERAAAALAEQDRLRRARVDVPTASPRSAAE